MKGHTCGLRLDRNREMKKKSKMQGKRVIVTGSGTGIGRGVALEFAKGGADVALHYAHSDAGAITDAETDEGADAGSGDDPVYGP